MTTYDQRHRLDDIAQRVDDIAERIDALKVWVGDVRILLDHARWNADGGTND